MRIWIVDVFADRAFSGATAGVLPLESWLGDDLMRAIATQNGSPETAFFAPTGLKGNYELRIFTARGDAVLSGHSALAAGVVLLSEIEPELELAVFDSSGGPLVVRRAQEGFAIDLPRRPRTPWTPPQALLDAVAPDLEIEDAFAGEYATLVLESEEALRRLTPDNAAIARLVPGPRAGCLAVTALADEARLNERGHYDFACRFFAPGAGVAEDSVTATAFADLTPYWCDRLDRSMVTGYQASRRGGLVKGRRTLSSSRLIGPASIYLRGALDGAVVGATPATVSGSIPMELNPLLGGPVSASPEEDDLTVHLHREISADAERTVTVFETVVGPGLSR